MSGAEKLLGKGDMLYSPAGSLKPKRVQGVFISESEVKNVVNWLKSQASPNYLSDIIDVEPINETPDDSDTAANTKDELYEEAKSLIMSTKYASTSYLQRKLRIGYNRAARIMDELTNDGVIAEYAGEKRPRQVSA
jgi:S-DNA-T family DNA segregation ATPase FtsK/SpoIIIE